jgi:hypothetical protein
MHSRVHIIAALLAFTSLRSPVSLSFSQSIVLPKKLSKCRVKLTEGKAMGARMGMEVSASSASLDSPSIDQKGGVNQKRIISTVVCISYLSIIASLMALPVCLSHISADASFYSASTSSSYLSQLVAVATIFTVSEHIYCTVCQSICTLKTGIKSYYIQL